MALKDNLGMIANAVKERKEYKTTIRAISDTQNEERKDETVINSVIQEMMSTFFAVAERARETNIELVSMLIEPNDVRMTRKDKDDINSDDPRVIIEYAKTYEPFTQLFDISMRRDSETGKEQFLLSRKEIDDSHFNDLHIE